MLLKKPQYKNSSKHTSEIQKLVDSLVYLVLNPKFTIEILQN